MTIRLLSTYGRAKPNTILTLASGTETALVAGGYATTDLSGGVPFDHVTPANTRQNGIAYGTDGVPLGYSDSTGKVLAPFPGISAPGAPTGLTLTAIAGGVLAAFAAPASNGGTVVTGYEVTLSTGQKQLGGTTTVAVNAPAGVAVTATVKAINGYDLSAASTVSASATPTAFAVPARPGAPTIGTLVAGNGKVTVNWTAAAANGAAIRNYEVTLSNNRTVFAAGGATSIDVDTPNGFAVTATVRAANTEGQGPVSGVSNSVTPAAVTPAPLRFVTTQNRMASGLGTVPANRSAWDFRVPYVIASGDVDGIIFTWTNQNPAAPDSTALSPVVLTDVYVENSNASAAKELPLEGQSYPYTLVSGSNDIRHVKLLPADLGVSVFTPGDTLYVKGRGSMTPGMQFPNMADRIPVSDASKILWTLYDPTATTPSALSTPGVQTVTAGAAFPITSSGGFCPFALGTFKLPLASRKPSFAGFGDSNLFGFRDTATLYHGKGEFQRMLTGNGTASDLMAGGNFSVTGYTIQQINHPKIIYWGQFADKIIDEVLVNSFGATGVTDQATVRPIKQALWDAYTAINPNAPVYSCDVGPRTNGAWTLSDQSDQTYFAGFGPGGNVETFRTWFIAQAGLPAAYDVLVQFTAWRGSPDSLKWPGGGLTDDGTHGLSTVVAAKAAQLRAAVLA